MQLFFFGLSLVIYFVVHSLLAANRVKVFLMQNGLPKKYYRLIYNSLAIVLLIPIYFFYQNITSTYLFQNVGIRYLGLAMTIIGAILLLIALMQYNLSEFAGTQQLRTNVSPTPEQLKVTGFNAIVRHPLYFAMLIIFWGLFLFRSTDLFLIIALVSSGYLYFGTKLEEKKLEEAFGKLYLDYKNQVGMLFPFIK